MKKLLCICILLALSPVALALPESIQIVIGETYDFGETVSCESDIVSLDGSVLTGCAQGTTVVEGAEGKCFVVVRDQNAIAYLYGISRLMTHYVGESFAITGTIYSRYPIYEVTVRIGDEILHTENAGGVYRYSLSTIDAKVRFGLLSTGTKRFTIDVNTAGGSANVWDVTFDVVERDWKKLEKSQIASAEPVDAFFGDESFLFTYALDGSKILVEDAWVNENIIPFDFFYGVSYDINQRAFDNFATALGKILNSQVSMTYANGETRTCMLSDLVMYNLGDGAYNARFTSGGVNVSSHSFGTAIDVNSSLPVNRMAEENRQIIADAMGKLTYLGDGFTGLTAIYNFQYDGEPPVTSAVPDALKNCLLYEIAFAPAGFCWGYYFSSPCDPMHFSLTESPANERVVIVK